MNALKTLALALAVSAPVAAHADWFGLHADAKFNLFSGTGDMFGKYDRNFGPGLELGFTLVGIDIWGEAFWLGSEQYMVDFNIGHQFSFGSDLIVDLGIFTGPMLFIYAKEDPQPLVIREPLAGILEKNGVNADEFTSSYNKAMEKNDDLGRVALGWNLVRLRLAVAKKLAPFISLGAEGTFGYHYILSGEDIASGAKNEAINGVKKDNPDLPPEVVDALRDEVGAKEVDTDKLNGVNFSVGVFLKFDL